MDGEIDYSKYSLAELLEARRNINARRFPRNFANLEAAIARLQPNPNEANFDVSTEPDRSVWTVLDGPAQYESLPIKETALYIVVFGLAGLTVAFAFEFVLALLDWSVGSIARVVYYSLAVVPVGILFAKKHQRLPTANEFTGLVVATYISYALLGVLLVWVSTGFVVPMPESLGGWFVVVISAGMLFLIDFAFFFLAFRFPMRWTMQFYLRKFANAQRNSR